MKFCNVLVSFDRKAARFVFGRVKVAPKITFNGNTMDDIKFFLTFTFDLDPSKFDGINISI